MAEAANKKTGVFVVACNGMPVSEFKTLKEANVDASGKSDARFKFCEDEAAKNRFLSLLGLSTVASEESTDWDSPFPAVTSSMLSNFWSDVIFGRVEKVRSLVVTNPNYLVKNGDSPASFEPQFRGNALHVAVLGEKRDMLAAILGLIKDESLLRRYHLEDTEEALKLKASELLYKFLNDHDYSEGGTPLHWAAAFGSVDCVMVLVAEDKCNRFLGNFMNKTPFEVIKPVLEAAKKEKLRELLGSYVVCIETAEGPKLQILDAPAYERQKIADEKSLKAVAGPISPARVERFAEAWKREIKFDVSSGINTLTVKPILANITNQQGHGDVKVFEMKSGSYGKGIERNGRVVARRRGIQWAEKWSFLNAVIDICSPEGLRKFEGHLRGVKSNMTLKSGSVEPGQPTEISGTHLATHLEPTDDLSGFVDKFASLKLQCAETTEQKDSLPKIREEAMNIQLNENRPEKNDTSSVNKTIVDDTKNASSDLVQREVLIGSEEFQPEYARIHIALREGGFLTVPDVRELYPEVYDWYVSIQAKLNIGMVKKPADEPEPENSK